MDQRGRSLTLGVVLSNGTILLGIHLLGEVGFSRTMAWTIIICGINLWVFLVVVPAMLIVISDVISHAINGFNAVISSIVKKLGERHGK